MALKNVYSLNKIRFPEQKTMLHFNQWHHTIIYYTYALTTH